uniref:Uncharacterized protein n=1 Tax=Aureoumbra lagunensis TaxID=44058 RepID=A0A7S3JVX0_9STRA|mmetsp:Transcript_5071/g.7155  ORF Transcript_5071/g.7155 Transcript_5071/m.7155 type:complete len:200 (+) Transcript_5071:77-676(+)|eukprot:CAMPEP_0197302174 /NCGR_PEP_ID=MMETSP0890-20130614/50878_1 /TAXON_ID=44058 ORGANISM="Aureoumbra lagunensis, Strain CCMP1510" /NCGR_SAMPLE_ID=MMETSP0890 /ASSEMBLY_ACC=CAM_ASM_000533 /LENGTH=199 /DNA_ID=CAMNT_0042781697 /DNA_START=1698 /DNA_END=2297 /DNA_ORIENTATION=+
MGRVRRYKQVKAHDPFTKKKMGATCRKKGKAKEFDLPPEPEEFDEFGNTERALVSARGKRERRIERSWEREILGLSDLKQEEKVVIAPRGESETQKDFKQRLRREGAKFMKDAVAGGSSTKAKRKESLKLLNEKKKLRKKQRKRKKDDDDFLLEPQRISVTDRVDAPPVLSVRPRLPKKKKTDNVLSSSTTIIEKISGQ